MACSCFAACAIENGMLVVVGLAREGRENKLCESSYKFEKKRPNQSSRDFETDKRNSKTTLQPGRPSKETNLVYFTHLLTYQPT